MEIFWTNNGNVTKYFLSIGKQEEMEQNSLL